MDTVLSVFPIAFLVFLMTKKNSIPSHKAFPLIALILYILRLVYFKSDPNIINATVVSGLLYAWTPILIIWGAILLFKTMDVSGSMNVIRKWLNGISDNPVAQLMIIGWAFSFLVEGASGFGTPAALAAPILVGLGFDPIRVGIVCLIMNSVPISFGAVGTPTWFGLGEQLSLAPEIIREIGFKTALVHSAASLIIPIMALRFIVNWKQIKNNIVFIYLSILSCVIPYLFLAKYDYEFPSLAGGIIGFLLSVFLAHKKIGLADTSSGKTEPDAISFGNLIKATFPLWCTFLVLLITRIHQLGIKSFLTNSVPVSIVSLGTLGQLSISPSLVMKLNNIFMTHVSWEHKILYVPSIIPFLLVSLITVFVFKMNKKAVAQIWSESYRQIFYPILVLLSALVFVKLLMAGGEKSCANIIGGSFADFVGDKWKYFSSYLGALGAFFAGSNTVSNMTFGGIQSSIAENLGLSKTTILSLQSVGGAMGNMVCIHHIIAVCSILGILGQEGYMMKKTFIPMIVYGMIAAFLAYWM